MKQLFVLLLLLLSFSIGINAQLFRKNDKQQEKKSKVVKHYEYWDADSTIISAKGYFRNNTACKTWKYYHNNGVLRMKVKYGDRIRIKYYTRSRKLIQKGYAILDLDSEYAHFYWQGLWKYYNSKRRLYRIARFYKGVEVEVLYGPAETIYFE